MRTKEYDVNLNGRRLSIVRLKDGAIVAEAEIPVEATNAVVDVLTTAKSETPTVKKSEKTEAATEPKPKKTTTMKTKTKAVAADGSVQTT